MRGSSRFFLCRLLPCLAIAAVSTPAASDPGQLALEGVHTVGGLSYVEVVSGGALDGDALPMIVLLHGMGLRPRMFGPVLAHFPQRARFLLPCGRLPAGQGFEWFEPRT